MHPGDLPLRPAHRRARDYAAIECTAGRFASRVRGLPSWGITLGHHAGHHPPLPLSLVGCYEKAASVGRGGVDSGP